jgi:hypothetical protein
MMLDNNAQGRRKSGYFLQQSKGINFMDVIMLLPMQAAIYILSSTQGATLGWYLVGLAGRLYKKSIHTGRIFCHRFSNS